MAMRDAEPFGVESALYLSVNKMLEAVIKDSLPCQVFTAATTECVTVEYIFATVALLC
jgi:hypothetical protein